MTQYKPRKLLAATLGLATLSLAGCTTTSGNLIAPPDDAGTDVPEQEDAGEQDQDTGESDAGE